MWLFYKYLLYFHIIVAECSVAHVDACGKLFEAVANKESRETVIFYFNNLGTALLDSPNACLYFINMIACDRVDCLENVEAAVEVGGGGRRTMQQM